MAAARPPRRRAAAVKDDEWRRGFPPEVFTPEQLQAGALVLYVFGMCYMFLAIAITCDEFFVPALEVMSDRLDLSPDVAGATLMAMGGSAPEFFTSCVGTWIAKTGVGIGTIVGSAVFNVLFVIGSCALASPAPLALTWWPLLRDSLFYTVGLVLLTLFFHDERIEWYEALCLFSLYICYCVFMANSEAAEAWVKARLEPLRITPASVATIGAAAGGSQGPCDFLPVVPADGGGGRSSRDASPRNKPKAGSTGSTDWEPNGPGSAYAAEEDDIEGGNAPVDRKASSPKASARGGAPPAQPPAAAKPPLRLELASPKRAVPETGSTADGSTGAMSGAEAEDQDRAADAAAQALPPLDDSPSKRSAASKRSSETRSSLTSRGESEATQDWWDESGERGPLELRLPKAGSGPRAWLWLVLTAPILCTLIATIPDVRRPGRQWLYILSFTLAICWVAIFTYMMVWMASVAADEMGMSATLMGLTVLAVGTSIPDLITSVIVAKQGKGDMAVSSSIGSNIFDITVGLPIPWFSYAVANGAAVLVDGSGLHFSIPVLLAMLASTIFTIRCNRWVMSKAMGTYMFVLYAIFMAQGVITSVMLEQ